MPAQIALLLCLLAVLALLRIECTRTPSTSFALWIPTVWMFLAGSKPASRWFDFQVASNSSEGSPQDRLALATLILLGVLVLGKRKIDWATFLRRNIWLIVFFLYMGVSALWTDVPWIALKRWMRTSGVIVMALVVMSEQAPLQAFERILRRCAYALIPLSIVFIKYFPQLGRMYGRWDGQVMWTGVTTDKNSLGALCAVSAVVLSVALLRKRQGNEGSPTRLQKGADIVVLGGALFLLRGAEEGTYSASAIAVALLGGTLCSLLLRRRRGGQFTAAHLKGIAVVACVSYVSLWGVITRTGATMLGRRTDLTGRSTEIWPLVLQEAARHPILGSGYGGVWGLDHGLSTTLGLGQAHNGYLDVYVQLGIIGCVLLAAFLLEFCERTRREFQYDPRWGVFGIAFLFMNLIYNLSETAFFDVYFGVVMVFVSVVFSADSGVDGVRETRAAGSSSDCASGANPCDWRQVVRRAESSHRRPTLSEPTGRPAYEWPAGWQHSSSMPVRRR